MSAQTIQAFNQAFIESPPLQAKLQTLKSPAEFLAIAQEAGFDLTFEDLGQMAQQAYQYWITTLAPNTAQFFQHIHTSKDLNARLHNCQSISDVLVLAQTCDLVITEADLKQAAIAAATVSGFSFEKLWFRGLGLMP